MVHSNEKLGENPHFCAKLFSHRVVVLAEGKDLGVISEALAQSQLGDRLHGQTQQVGTQRGVLGVRERLPLPYELLRQLRGENKKVYNK